MHVGMIIAYRERGRLMLGVVHKVASAAKNAHVEILNEDGKKLTLFPDRIALDCKSTVPATLSPPEIKKHLQDLHAQISASARTVNLRDLWELLQDEKQVQALSWQDLAGFLTTATDTPLTTAGVLEALWGQNLYFKEKQGGTFVPRDEKSVEESLHQQWLEQERAKAQAEFLAWAKAQLAGSHSGPPPPDIERSLDLVKGLALYGDTFPKKVQALKLVEALDFRSKGHPWDVAFQLLVALGIWKEDEELSILRYQIPTRFSAEVLQEVEATSTFSPQIDGYTDLTSLFTFTIDDPDTTEIDDALSISTEGDTTLVGIHITDASFFIPPGGVLDKAALSRGTTVYLPRGKLPMLPPLVSEDKASLRADAVRPTLSFFANVDADGHIRGERICRGAIRVKQRLSYTEADALLQNKETTAPLSSALATLAEVAQARKALRVGQGAVIIDGEEVKVKVCDSDISVTVFTNSAPARCLVSECMILANEIAARYCRAHHLPALYIAQPPPDEAVPSATTFPTQRVYVHAARRLMKPAQMGVVPAPHIALGLDVYTQVTSPLRRYHDLQMQHQIKHHLTHGTSLFDEDRLLLVAGGTQESTADAKRCERESTRYWLLRLLETHKGHVVHGQVVREQNRRSFIELDETLLVVPVHVSPPLPLGTPVRVVIGHVDARRDILTVRLA